MQTFFATIVMFVFAMLALGIGVLFGRSEPKGSCGGLACNGACGSCTNREKKR